VGLTLAKLGRHEEALLQLEGCRCVAPHDVAVLCGLGHVSYDLGKLAEARAHFNAALALDPASADAYFGIGNIDLLEGAFESGWQAYEWRTRLPRFARYYPTREELWGGEPLMGKRLVVNAEQGFGDTLMFVRFLARLHETGAEVVFRCRRPLVRLLRGSLDAHRVIDVESADPVQADASVPLLSLPHRLRITPSDLPGPMPYLRAPDDLSSAWHAKVGLDRNLRVGIAWRGNALRAHQQGRVPTIADYDALAGVPGVSFYNLDLGCLPAERARFPTPLIDLTDSIADFADTSGLIANLDLIVSVDTVVAHLAGARMKPVWLLHSGIRDWRWEVAGRDSPWYPSVRLFRRGASWAQTLTQVAQALQGVRPGAFQ
jgi:tetratricopeptide (TPR) repeat protein